MDFFSDNYKALYALPNDIYADIKRGLLPFFQLKNSSRFVGDVVCIEPKISKDTNALIREHGTGGNIECQFLMITSRRQEGGTYIYGFVRLDTLPEPFTNIINSLYSENRNLRAAVRREGLSADLLALGAE